MKINNSFKISKMDKQEQIQEYTKMIDLIVRDWMKRQIRPEPQNYSPKISAAMNSNMQED